MNNNPKQSTSQCATYEEAMAYLFEMVDYEKLASYKYTVAEFDLMRTELLLESVGSPHKDLKMTHIAGTKGKGSTAMMTQAMLTHAGYKTGLYTSPHLVHLEERMTVDGKMMPHESLVGIVNRLRPYVDAVRRDVPRESPTFFELVTVLGFTHFADEKVDFAVIEVGMGGRLDSTNVIAPVVTVISKIDFDHVKRLGPTLNKIAYEKAGIIKPGVPVVCAEQMPEAFAVIERIATERKAPLYVLGRDFTVSNVDSTLEGDRPWCRFTLRTPKREYCDITMPLLGRHQAANAALAIRSVEFLEEGAGARFDEGIAREALAKARCPARIEIVPGRPMTILDGAHNVAAMKALSDVMLKELRGRRVIFVFGVAKDKDVEGILRGAAPFAHKMVLTKSDSPRATDADELLEKVQRIAPSLEAVAIPDAAMALDQARAWARPEDVICITGSLYLAGKLRPLVLPGEYAQ